MTARPFATVIEPTRLQAGDIVQYHGKPCKVVRCSPCCAVLEVKQPRREFQARDGRTVRLPAAPALERISANSPLPILRRRP